MGQAINLYIVVEPITEELKDSSGMVLTGSQEDAIRYRKGKVISVGTQIPEGEIKENDVILYDIHAGFTLFDKDGDRKIIKYSDVVMIE